jgi:hypothetical protein
VVGFASRITTGTNRAGCTAFTGNGLVDVGQRGA